MHKQLKKQFEAMDQSGDGSLSKEELVNFLFDKVKGQMSPSKQADTRQNYEDLAEALFSKIDVDNDQKVRLDEFVDFYYLEQRQLIEQIEETKLRISDSKTRADQIQIKIADLQPQEKYTNNPHPYLNQGFVQPPEGYNTWHIMKGSVLQVNVIDARNLVSKK